MLLVVLLDAGLHTSQEVRPLKADYWLQKQAEVKKDFEQQVVLYRWGVRPIFGRNKVIFNKIKIGKIVEVNWKLPELHQVYIYPV